MLTDAQLERYRRNVLLPGVGEAGQERLLAARVAVAGLGPAGAWAIAYLALAGVGRLELWDPGPVCEDELSPFLGAAAIGRRRDEALAAAVPAYNPDVVASVIAPGSGADALVLSDPELIPGLVNERMVAALAAGDRSIAGMLPPDGPCASCVARALGSAERPAPVAALSAGALAAMVVLAPIAARVPFAGGFTMVDGAGLRRIESVAIGCPHRPRSPAR